MLEAEGAGCAGADHGARVAVGSPNRSDRLTVQGRTAGLKCHSKVSDAGAAAGDAGP